MTILVNNTPAVLRADIAFDYVAKNSLFDNKDGYTLEITFPLKDCLTNMQIFGVTEAIPDIISTPYDCRIIEGDFDKRGILRVLSVTAHELQAQFVEYGPSAQPIQTSLQLLDGGPAIADWNTVTLPELMADVTLTPGNYTYGTDYEQVTFYDEREEKVWDFDEQGHADDGRLFCQWYFHRIVRAVIEQLGYAADFSHLTDHYLFWHLLSLNAHFTDQSFATSLPDWTVSKFFEQIEHLFAVRVVVDNNAKTIALVPLSEFYNPNTTIEVEPSTDHEVETLDEDQTTYWKHLTNRYADTDPYDNCQWFIDKMVRDGGVLHLESLDYLNQCLTQTLTLSDLDEAQTWKEQIDARYLIEASGYYFLLREGQGTQRGMWDIVPLNCFAANEDAYALDFHPAGWHTFADANDDAHTVPVVKTPEPEIYSNREGFVYHAEGLPFLTFRDGEQKKEDLFFGAFFVVLCARRNNSSHSPILWTSDVINRRLRLNPSMPYYHDFVGSFIYSRFKDGETGLPNEEMFFTKSLSTINEMLENAFITVPVPTPSLSLSPVYRHSSSSLLTPPTNLSPARIRAALPDIDPTRLYRFDFLYKGVPDPKAVYRIHGKRYLCRQLTAQMTADGISDFKQGEFFRIAAAESNIRDADMADEM